MKKSKGFGLVEIVVSMVILGIMYFVVSKTLFRGPADAQTVENLKKEGVDASNSPAMMQKARENVGKYNEAEQQRVDEAKEAAGE